MWEKTHCVFLSMQLGLFLSVHYVGKILVRGD
jgi:hypothetical protein